MSDLLARVAAIATSRRTVVDAYAQCSYSVVMGSTIPPRLGDQGQEIKMDQLRIERQALADKAYNTYSPSNYPGSKAWRANMAAESALEAFDAAHPEIIAEIKAARDAKPLSDAAARALRGED